MITTKDVVKAINTVLKAHFRINRSYRQTRTRRLSREVFMWNILCRSWTGQKFQTRVRDDLYRLLPYRQIQQSSGVFNVQEKLREAFADTLTVEEDFVIPINELQFTENDDVLILQFDYEMWQYIEETGPDMEELVIKEE